MPWFNVDDGFHSHPKAIAAGPAAIGLWVMAGSWSAKHLTNGFIPRHVLASLSPDPHRGRHAKRLVAAGLWEEVPGEGWQFHDWNDDGRNPTPEQVRAAKAANRDRQQRYRDRHRNAVTNAPLTADVTRESQRPLPSTPYIEVDAVTEPAGRHHRQPVENPSFRKKINPQDGLAGRLPSARPLAAALEAAGINGTPPLRGQAVADFAAQARRALEAHQDTEEAAGG